MAGTAADPPTNRAALPSFSGVSSLWVHARFSPSASTTSSGTQPVRLYDGSTCRLIIRGTGTNNTLKLSSRTAAGTITDLLTFSANVWTNSAVNTFDLFVNYAVSGSATLYLNGTSVGTYTGDVTTDSATTLSQVEFSGGIGVNTSWSECLVRTSDTRSSRVWYIGPQAAGNTQGWTPNTVGNINEVGANDTTLISTSSNNILSEWTTPTSIPSGSWSVDAIGQSARVQVAVTGPQHFDWVCRTADGTDNLAGASLAPSTSFGNFRKLWLTNPKTAADWGTSDITTGFNLGIKSLA
jgi:hypothetical protein